MRDPIRTSEHAAAVRRMLAEPMPAQSDIVTARRIDTIILGYYVEGYAANGQQRIAIPANPRHPREWVRGQPLPRELKRLREEHLRYIRAHRAYMRERLADAECRGL